MSEKDRLYRVAAAMEQAEAFLLGGDPTSLVCNADKPNPSRAESVLASVESMLKEDGFTGNPSDNVLAVTAYCAALKCQLAGFRGDCEAVLLASDKALQAFEMMDKRIDTANCSSSHNIPIQGLEASVLGYKGFALVKLGRHSDALEFLEQSVELWREIGNSSPQQKQAVTLQERRKRREARAAEQALTLCYQTLGVQPPPPPVVKFPRTAHLFDTGGTATTPDDLVVSDKEAILATICDGETRVVMEEKVDGANLGFSQCNGKIFVQNRSHYISSVDHIQYNRITEWVAEHQSALMSILSPDGTSRDEKRTLYGEWVVAKHSIPYTRLPGFFVAFDIYDQVGDKFFSRARFHTTMKGTGIPVVPVICTKTFGPYSGAYTKRLDSFYSTLRSLLNTPSCFRDDGGFVEGIVLRVDQGDHCYSSTAPMWMEHRWKIVRPDFVQGCQGGHWSSRKIEKQRVDYEFAERYLRDCYMLADWSFSKQDKQKNAVFESGGAVSSDDEQNEETTQNAPATEKQVSKKSKKKQQEPKGQLSARSRRRVPRCVLLMGLPASGKSTFASRLAASSRENEQPWTVVNQDTMGRKECVEVAGRVGRRNRIILDRCNLRTTDRTEWLAIMHNPPPHEVALVYFSASYQTCAERAAKRIGHETIPCGRGERVIEILSNRIETPTEEEQRNIFGAVEVVRTFEESDQLLRRWGVDSLS